MNLVTEHLTIRELRMEDLEQLIATATFLALPKS